jgi:tetratricopeptide (TPR) repeat protein
VRSLGLNVHIAFLFRQKHGGRAAVIFWTCALLFSKASNMDPNFYLAHLYMGWAYDQKGMHDESIASVQRALTLSAGGMLPLGSLAYSYALAGKRDQAKRMLAELGELSDRTYVPALYSAVIHAALGETDDAFQWLERAYDERSNWLTLFRMDPRVDSLRSDARFEDLMRRVGFQP